MGSTMRITESELKKLVKEAIKETFKKHKGNNILGYENDNADVTIPNGANLGIMSINERTAGEEGMTDDEVRNKRTQDFIEYTNWKRSIWDNPSDDDMFLAGKDRYRKHLDAQNGSRFRKKAERAYKQNDNLHETSMKHGTHTLDKYLDDDDFNMLVQRIYNYMLKNGYSILDFESEDEYNSDVIELIADFVTDFADNEACDEFGYKYGWQAPVNRYVSTAENIYNKIKTMMLRQQTEKTYKLNEKLSVGDSVSVQPHDASSVGYNGSFGKIRMVRQNKKNGKTMYYVIMYNSDNGAWFYEDELVKQK